MAIKSMTKQATIGIDLWHAVEFSRYGCALRLRISPDFQGRSPNLVHARRRGQTGPNEVLDLAEAQFLELLCLLLRPKSSVPSKERNYTEAGWTGQIDMTEIWDLLQIP
jgi:hypothetical protein